MCARQICTTLWSSPRPPHRVSSLRPEIIISDHAKALNALSIAASTHVVWQHLMIVNHFDCSSRDLLVRNKLYRQICAHGSSQGQSAGETSQRLFREGLKWRYLITWMCALWFTIRSLLYLTYIQWVSMFWCDRFIVVLLISSRCDGRMCVTDAIL